MVNIYFGTGFKISYPDLLEAKDFLFNCRTGFSITLPLLTWRILLGPHNKQNEWHSTIIVITKEDHIY